VEVLFLGSSGATMTPRVGCPCRICERARRLGGRDRRSGPSLYLTAGGGPAPHLPGILIDTPEEIHSALLRWDVSRVDAVFYTHWHPDHTAGVRLFEHLNMDWLHPRGPRPRRTTPVYLPERVARDFETRHGLMEKLRYLEGRQLIEVREIAAGQVVREAGLELRAYPMANPELWTYEVTGDGRRAVLAVDDTRGYQPEEFLSGADLAVLETGWFTHGGEGESLFPEGVPTPDHEASFEESLQIARRLRARRTVFTHIEEINQRFPEDYQALASTPPLREIHAEFAVDGLRIHVGEDE
jgi:phosphoribosyl 1,2-cyclic phosphate phosphodiesterase